MSDQKRVDTVWITLRTSHEGFPLKPGMDVHEFVFGREQICRLFNDDKTTLREFFRAFLPSDTSGDETIEIVRRDAETVSLIPGLVKATRYNGDGKGGEEKIG